MTRNLPETAVEIAEEVGAGRIDPSLVVRRSLERIAARDGELNALTRINPDAVPDAIRLDRRLEAGERLPLAGVPVVIKDNIWVEGLRVTQGARLYEHFVAPQDAEAVRRLRQAGAVVVGIGTCSEFACKGVTNTPLYGKTRNPVDPRLTPGGSSGGPAVAVAAGYVPLALGTDAGGSTRRPPAHVGVIGFKPSQDLVPYGPGFHEPVWGISTICPIAQEMADVILAMRVLGGVEVQPPLGVARLAYATRFGLDQPLDADVAENFQRVITRLGAAGYPLTEASPEWP
ncbi:MAG TPA: amidase, partial [Tabrizicola sp.]|nr:amidase [Tabrizicola sp.]